MNMKPTIEINEENFETEVLKSSQPVLVEFATRWSLPSMTANGATDEIAAEFVDFLKVGRVQLDGSPNLGLWYGIRCLPTILYFSDGEVRVGIFGTANKEAILSQLKPIIASRDWTLTGRGVLKNEAPVSARGAEPNSQSERKIVETNACVPARVADTARLLDSFL
jgi:thioredoxin 1